MKILLNVSPESLGMLMEGWNPVAGIRMSEDRDGSFNLHVAPDEEALNRAIRAEMPPEEPPGPTVEMPPGVDLSDAPAHQRASGGDDV